MITRFPDFDPAFFVLDDLRRRMDRMFLDADGGRRARAETDRIGGIPAANVTDLGASLAVHVELPGLTEKDVSLTLDQDVLTLRGERKNHLPKGYSVHRQERPELAFARSFSLPCKVDAEKTTASMKDGVLTVTLAKVPEAQPRRIAITAN